MLSIDSIGHTPLIEITGLNGQQAHVWVKVEGLNPGGSIKDRTALSMIEDAEVKGLLAPGATIIEPTSGNTGIGLAWIGSQKGYKVVLTMPNTMSEERRTLLRTYGAELVLTDGSLGMLGAIEKAKELHQLIAGSVILDQFTNEANPRIHFLTTGEEIWEDTKGLVDVLVAGVGTGGTLIGCSRCLKGHKTSVEAVAVEPASSPVLSGGKAAPHGLQGIGANFIPAIYEASLVDQVIGIEDKEAIDYTRLLARKYNILAGISSGAALAAAAQLARKDRYKNQVIVVILPDTGERYLSMHIFD